jgi:ABC-type transporter Mla subunit MlaD
LNKRRPTKVNLVGFFVIGGLAYTGRTYTVYAYRTHAHEGLDKRQNVWYNGVMTKRES